MPFAASAHETRTNASSPTTSFGERRSHRSLLPSAQAAGSTKPRPEYSMNIV